MALHSDYSCGQTYTQDNQKYTVVSNLFDSDYITVRDDAGNIIRHKKNDAILKFQSEKEAERDEKIAHYEQKAKDAGLLKQDWTEKIKELFKRMSGLNEKDKEYAILKDEYWAARFARVSASNQEYSAYMDAFMIASDPIV